MSRRRSPKTIARRAERAVILACALLLLTAASCATGESDMAITLEPVVVPRTGAAAAAPAEGGAAPAPKALPPTKAEIENDLRSMASAMDRGDYERALEIGDALVARGVSGELRDQVDVTRLVARQHLMQTFYLDAVVRVDRPRVAVGEPISGEVVLINLSPDPLVITDAAVAATPGGRSSAASRTILHMDVGYAEYGADGTFVRDRLTWNVVVGAEIRLAPGERRSFPINIDTLAQNPSGVMLRHYDIGGMLYLAELRAGAEIVPGNVKLRPARASVFPRNYEHLADEPLARLREAISKRSPIHIPLAAALVGPEERRDALMTIERGIRDDGTGVSDPATRVACCVALTILTGEDRQPEPARWSERLAEMLR